MNQHPIDRILPLLQKVRRSEVANHWMALCPAHKDRSPSLSVRQYDDGSISVKCFSGCPTAKILHAVGLDPRDLFPRIEKGQHSYRPGPQATPWRAALTYLRQDLEAVQIGAARIAAGDELSDDDLDCLATAAVRVSELLERIRQ